jgi:hyperosmotically inducible periplasmic protein
VETLRKSAARHGIRFAPQIGASHQPSECERWKMTRKILVCAAGLLLVAQVSFADAGGQGVRKDLQVLKDVAASVDRYTQFTIFDDVNASVKDGVVTLTGKVTMPFKRDDIEKRVAKIDGVRALQDNIDVLPVSQFDDELRLRIARSIYGNQNFWNYGIMPSPPIHIVVEHGRVTLTGVVQSDVERMLARSLATRFGALSVTNSLKTDAEVRDALEKSE